ncbi:hypothetical protein ACQWSB_003665 [Enterobacter hormaechei]
MNVKRYWISPNGIACEDNEGKFVRYEDYAALEARCAALAAENAGLKAAHPQPFGPVMMKALDAYEKHQDETPETGMLDAFFILRDSIRVDTTATDAFLAEVRAQGVEMFAASLKVAGGHDHPYSAVASEFAAQLRKGVQS